MFLGTGFLGLDTIPYPTKNINSMNKIVLNNSVVDALHIEKCTSATEEEYYEIPTFSWNTIFSANFDDNLTAGNTDWILNNIQELYVKMREKGTFDWITIQHYFINNLEDFTFSGMSFLNASGKTYEIAFVPIIKSSEGSYEGSYSIYDVESKFDSLMLCDKDSVYSTLLDVGSCDTTRNISNVTIEGLYEKYPYYFKTSEAEYDTGEAEACWIEYNKDKCNFDVNGQVDFVENVKKFISNGKPKLLKHYDGRNWLIAVTDKPTDTEDGHYQHRILKFSWVEIGDAMSEKDLYDNGITNIGSEYFSKVYE